VSGAKDDVNLKAIRKMNIVHSQFKVALCSKDGKIVLYICIPYQVIYFSINKSSISPEVFFEKI
jgi:hypothetical protein